MRRQRQAGDDESGVHRRRLRATAQLRHHGKELLHERSRPVSRPNPLLEGLFGGNMLEGTFKAVAWVAILCVLLAWSTLR